MYMYAAQHYEIWTENIATRITKQLTATRFHLTITTNFLVQFRPIIIIARTFNDIHSFGNEYTYM